MARSKRVRLTIEQKARFLQVIDIHEPGVLAVRSDSDPSIAYAVKHNGKVATHCACPATKACSHMQAVTWHLEAKRRAYFTDIFGIYEI